MTKTYKGIKGGSITVDGDLIYGVMESLSSYSCTFDDLAEVKFKKNEHGYCQVSLLTFAPGDVPHKVVFENEDVARELYELLLERGVNIGEEIEYENGDYLPMSPEMPALARKRHGCFGIIGVVIIIIVIILVIRGGNGGDSGTTSTDSGYIPAGTLETRYDSVPALQEQPQGDADPRAAIALIEIVLRDNHGDSYTVEFDDSINAIIASVWMDGLAIEVGMAIDGNEQLRDEWSSVVESIKYTAIAMKSLAETTGSPEINVIFNLLNDIDRDYAFIVIMNGIVVYDVLE